MDQWYRPGGCKEKMRACQKIAEEEDPNWKGNVPSVTECFDALKGRCISIMDAADGIKVSSQPVVLKSRD